MVRFANPFDSADYSLYTWEEVLDLIHQEPGTGDLELPELRPPQPGDLGMVQWAYSLFDLMQDWLGDAENLYSADGMHMAYFRASAEDVLAQALQDIEDHHVDYSQAGWQPNGKVRVVVKESRDAFPTWMED